MISKHGITRVRVIEGMVNDVEQDVIFPNDDLMDNQGHPKVYSEKIYYITPENKEQKK